MLNCSLLVAYGLCASEKDRPGQRVLFRSKEGRGPWSRLGAPAATASHRAPSLPKVSVKYAKTSRSVPKIRSTSLNFSQNFVPSMMMSRSPSAFAATTSRYSYSRIRAANAPCFCAHRSASDWLTHSADRRERTIVSTRSQRRATVVSKDPSNTVCQTIAKYAYGQFSLNVSQNFVFTSQAWRRRRSSHRPG